MAASRVGGIRSRSISSKPPPTLPDFESFNKSAKVRY